MKKIKARQLHSIRHSHESGNPGKTKGLDSCLRMDDNTRKYLFILGEKDGINTAVIWRNYNDKPALSGAEGWSEEDFKKDKEFIINEIKSWVPRVVYVNGQSVLTTNLDGNTVEIRYIEPEFKTLMEG